MEWELNHTLCKGILIVVWKGQISEKDAPKAVQQFVEILAQSDAKKVLCDTRELQDRLSYAGTYFLARDNPVFPYKTRTAILDRPENAQYAEFHQTTYANVGINFRYFYNYQEAMDWLSEVEEVSLPHVDSQDEKEKR